MKQDCNVLDKENCKPTPANRTEPFILQDDPKVVCKEFIGKESCCTPDQNILIKDNFDSLDSLFGTKFGGCDICAINLKRFWCYFTCSPNQHEFCNY
jgi:hypothetical protein